MTTIDQFVAKVKGGLQMSHNFEVEFLTSGNSDAARTLTLMCDDVTVPGMTLASNTVFTFGEPREVVYNRVFEPATFMFMVDIQNTAPKFFREWMDRIINPRNRLTSYYNDYAANSKVVIKHLNAEKQPVYSVTLYEAFPKALQSYNLSNSSKDVLRFGVTMNYKYWEQTTLAVTPVTQNLGNQRTVNGGTPT